MAVSIPVVSLFALAQKKRQACVGYGCWLSVVASSAEIVKGITAAFFNHFARRCQRGFNSRKTPENGFSFPPKAPSLWIKFGPDAPTVAKEARMQSYVYENWSSQENFRVPKIHHVLKLPDKRKGQLIGARLEDLPWGLMVMDYIKGTRLLDMSIHEQDPAIQEVLASRIATVLVTMSFLQPLQDTAPGSGEDYAMSSLVWGNDEFVAPQGFKTVEAMQGYINEQVEGTVVDEPADFSSEPLCLCYGDFNIGNFMLEDPTDPHSTLAIIDFESTNWLPISFLQWEVMYRSSEDGPFYRRLADASKKLLPEPPNMNNVRALHALRWVRGRQGY